MAKLKPENFLGKRMHRAAQSKITSVVCQKVHLLGWDEVVLCSCTDFLHGIEAMIFLQPVYSTPLFTVKAAFNGLVIPKQYIRKCLVI